MLTALKPSWPSKLYEDELQVSQRILLPLRDPNIENVNPDGPKQSSNKPTMKTLQESRRIFLENLQNTTQHSSDVEEHRKKRKISFKIKNSSGGNRRIPQSNSTTTLSANKVQQLTSKFNELIHEQPKMARVIRRVNSTKLEQNKKPLIRPKPSRVDDKKRPSIKRKASVKKLKDQVEKHTNLENVHLSNKHQNVRNSVKETIEIFERRKSESLPPKSPEKPKIPEKNVCKTKELVIKDGVKKFKILASEKSKTNLTELQNYFETKSTIILNKNSTDLTQLNDTITLTEKQPRNETNLKELLSSSDNQTIAKSSTKMTTNVTETQNNEELDSANKKTTKPPTTKNNETELPTFQEIAVLNSINNKKRKSPTKLTQNNKTELPTFQEVAVLNSANNKIIKPLTKVTKNNETELPTFQEVAALNSAINKIIKPLTKLTQNNKTELPTFQEVAVLNSVNNSTSKSPTKSESNVTETQNKETELPIFQEVVPDSANKKATKSPTKKLYETLKITKTTSSAQVLKMATEEKLLQETVKPNNSFLWRSRSRDSTSFNIYTSIDYEDQNVEMKKENIDNEDVEHEYEDTGQVKSENLEIENLYDTVDPQIIDEYKDKYEKLLAKTDEILKDFNKSNTLDNVSNHSYESFCNQNEYEYSDNIEDIYETLSLKNDPSVVPTKITQKPLPLIPQDSSVDYYSPEMENIYSTLPSTPSKVDPLPSVPKIEVAQPSTPEEDIYAIVKDPYEKISKGNDSLMSYESFLPLNLGKGDDLSSCGSNRGSILSCDQQSNSLYGRYAPGSDNSSTDRSERSNSDDWIDLSDVEEEELPGFVIVREKQKLSKKNSGWSNKVRDQWTKSPKKVVVLEEDALSDSYHYYESLHSDDDFDSFDSESDDDSFTKINPNDSGVEMGLSRLPDPPSMSGGNIYGLTRLAARLRKNWSLTKNDISKSLSRMTKKKTVVGESGGRLPPPRPPPPLPTTRPRAVSTPALPKTELEPKSTLPYQNVEFQLNKPQEQVKTIQTSASTNSMGRKKNWLKFRRAVSMGETSAEESQQPTLQVFNPNVAGYAKSTFYLSNESEPDLGEKPQVPARRRAPRPQSPPPPAPVGPLAPGKPNKEKLRSTSWYAECGLFKASDLQVAAVNVIPPDISATTLTPQRSSNTCWYAEVGLYQQKKKKSISSSSSVENSGNSSTKEVKIYSPKPDLIPNSKFYTDPSQEELDVYYNIRNQNYYNSDSLKRFSNDKMATLLRDEPLYQFYDAAVAENALNESSSDSEYDGYEEIGELAKIKDDQTVLSIRTRLQGCRTLWCEIPEVIQSEILRTLTSTQRKLQEAKFEIITSEASYLNSLNVLTDHFIPKLNQENLLSEPDRQILFGNIYSVKQCSEKLLTELETCWQESILLPNICSIIKNYCDEHFTVYVEYCANQTLSDSVLRKCRGETSPKSGKSPSFTRFAEVIKRLEACATCQGLSLHSFLMLPMQRVTRLPLLIDAVLRRLTPSDDDFPSCQAALRALHDLATRCNEAARHAERLSELQRLAGQLEYPAGVPVVDLVTEGAKRYLVRSGELTQLLARGGAKGEEQGMKLTFGKRFTKQLITVMLFEDWVIIARKKSEDSFSVLHHCPRSFLELSPPDAAPPTLDSALLLFITLLENQDGKQISLLLSCSSETEKTRWVEALRPPQAEDPNEVIYESWDCPQVQSLHHYESIQPDELSLKRGDVVNVDKKMKDGWYHGERLRDGQTGWFPGNHTIEIANPHVRARNLRQRYRLLAYTDEFLNNSQNKT